MNTAILVIALAVSVIITLTGEILIYQLKQENLHLQAYQELLELDLARCRNGGGLREERAHE